MVRDPRATESCPKLVDSMLSEMPPPFEAPPGLKFRLLNTLKASARTSSAVPSPSPLMFPKPKLLLSVASTSRYPGPISELRLTPGRCGGKAPVAGNTGPGGRGRRCEVREPSVGEVGVYTVAHAGARFEGIIAGIMTRSAPIGSGQQGGIAVARGAIKISRRGVDRAPWKSGVQIEDPADVPAARDAFDPLMISVEQDGLPHAEDLFLPVDVVIGSSVRQAWVIRVELLEVGHRNWCPCSVPT